MQQTNQYTVLRLNFSIDRLSACQQLSIWVGRNSDVGVLFLIKRAVYLASCFRFFSHQWNWIIVICVKHDNDDSNQENFLFIYLLNFDAVDRKARKPFQIIFFLEKRWYKLLSLAKLNTRESLSYARNLELVSALHWLGRCAF